MSTEPPVEFVFFDIGKVLFDFDYRRAWNHLHSTSQFEEEDLLQRARASRLFHQYESGRMDTPTFFQTLRKEFRLALPEAEIRPIWNDIFTPLDSHLEAAHLIAKRFPTGIISNISETHVTYLKTLTDVFDQIKDPTFSYEVGICKPDHSIYHRALDSIGAVAGRSLFIDDMEENIRAATEIGFQTVHCTPDLNLSAELKRRGLLN